MKTCKSFKKKDTENEIDVIFSCDKYDNIQWKAFNDITKNKAIKHFFEKGSLRALDVFGQFLVRALE